MPEDKELHFYLATQDTLWRVQEMETRNNNFYGLDEKNPDTQRGMADLIRHSIDLHYPTAKPVEE